MKGKLEELEEPVDDLMEVSKIQTQILNLTKNQVNIYDEANDKFRSTYDILKDVSAIWDTLSSTDRASLTEIMFGKLRANQGLAIIQAFQSGQIEKAYQASTEAAGTATKENEEMMKSIQAHIDALKEAFQKLSTAVIDSGFLKSVIDSGKTILNLLTWITKNLGTLTTLGAGFGLFSGFKNAKLFNISAIKEARTALAAYNAQLRSGNAALATQNTLQDIENTNLRTYIANLNGAEASLGGYVASLVKAKLATIALRAATIVFNTALTMGISLAIQGVITLVDKLIVTKDELNEIRDSAVNDMNKLADSIKKFNSEKEEVADLVKQYQSLALSTNDISSNKDELLKIQDSLVEKYGNEAKSIDLVNGKYDEQIAKIKELSDAEYDDWITKNADKIAKAEKMASYNVGWYENVNGELVGDKDYSQLFLKGYVQKTDELAASLYKIKGVSEEIQNVWQNVKGVEFVDGVFSNTLYLSGELEDAREQVRQLIQEIQDAGASDKALKPLTKQFETIETALKDIAIYTTESSKSVTNVVDSIVNNVGQTINKAFSDVVNVTAVSGEEMTNKWLEDLDEMKKGSLKNISTMVSALQDLAEGKGIAANTFWSLVEFDTEGLLNGAKLIGDKFYITQENMVKLKDQYVQKQIDSIQLLQVENEKQKQAYENDVRRLQLQIDTWKFSEKSLANPAYRKEYDRLISQLEIAKEGAKAYGDDWERNNWLIQYFNQSLGNTVDKQKELEAREKAINKEITALNKELDNYVKAHETVIDNIVKDIEREQDELEKQKDVLQDELDILNKQKDAIEETLSNYESVNKLVQDTIKKEVDALEEQKKSIEDTYKKRIDNLKAENQEREDALEYAQKLKNLENAQNNKVRVYDEARGWHYASNQDDIKNAQNELNEYENRKAIEQLEAERDALVDAVEDIIESRQKYADEWGEVSDKIQEDTNEEIAVEILGADWRDKISKGDIELLKQFTSKYLTHNSDLKRLVGTEINLKNQAIEAKDAEIDAKKKQAQAWKDYKTDITNAVTEIKTANEGYMAQLGQIKLNEGSSLEDREKAFATFKNNVTGYIDQIAGAQSQLDYINSLQESLGGDYYYNVEVSGLEELEKAAAASVVLSAGSASAGATLGAGAAMMVAGNPIAQTADNMVDAITQVMNRIRGFSQGGVVDSTGIAMLHGRKNAPETIFNAKDSAKLYDMVHNTPNLMANVMAEAQKLAGFKLNNANSNNSSINVNIGSIYANNPQELTKGLDQHLDRYFKRKLTSSYTQR